MPRVGGFSSSVGSRLRADIFSACRGGRSFGSVCERLEADGTTRRL